MKWLQAQPLGELCWKGFPRAIGGASWRVPTARINFHATFAGVSDAQGRADLIPYIEPEIGIDYLSARPRIASRMVRHSAPS